MASNVVSAKGSVSSGSDADHVTIRLHKEKARDLLLALTTALSGSGNKGKSGKATPKVTPKPRPKGANVKPKK